MRPLIIAVLAAFAAFAASPARPATPFPPRAAGPDLALAVTAAQGAVRACRQRGFPIAVLVVDSAGEPEVLLVREGAPQIAASFARRKTALTMRYHDASGAVAARAAGDTKLAAEIKADPAIGMALPGALPIIAGGKQVGAIAASGAGSAKMDEDCARAGLDTIARRLR
ncbi:MAG: heme-binding protein [Croceibacterium sp.]